MNRVFITKVSSDNLSSRLSDAFGWIEWEKIVKNGDKVFIKPNLTLPSYHRGITTNPLVLDALVRKLRNRTNRIYMGESNGGLECFSANNAFLGHGLDKLASKYGIKLINLSSLPFKKVAFQLKRKQVEIEIPNFLVDDVDVFINVPVLKTHAMVNITLGFKNLWGCIPNTSRMLYHPVFHEVIVEIAKLINPKITIIDGTYAMDGNGPIFGDVFELNTMIASNDFGAADLVGCHVMQFDPRKVKYLGIAKKQDLIPELEEILLNESIQKFSSHKFKPVMRVNNYVAYAAFRSKLLTKFIYFSPFSKLKDAIVRRIRGEKGKELFKYYG